MTTASERSGNNMEQYNGIFPAMVTPFNSKGEVNYSVIEDLIEKFVSDDLDGVYITGSTGEFPLLTVEEHKNITKTACETAGNRLKTIVHVGSTSLKEAQNLAEYAAKCGATAISSVAPFFFKYSFSEIKEYYTQLSKVGMPIIIYNVPTFTNTSLTIENIKELAEIDNVIGMKHTSSDMYILERIKTKMPHFSVFSGPDEMCLSAYAAGADGAIGSTYNFMGQRFKKILKYYDENKNALALEEQRKANSVIEALLKSGVIQSVKYILKRKYKIDCGNCREPMAVLNEEQKHLLDEAMDKYL